MIGTGDGNSGLIERMIGTFYRRSEIYYRRVKTGDRRSGTGETDQAGKLGLVGGYSETCR